ncbi:MAG: glycosyltransferase family 2 protein [Duncaniella sp.]|nr:glycosyltransferase family 2 protein [Duncaniella sp.]
MITVVIPVFNREATLPSTLASVDAQKRRHDRVILVDNGSTDTSLSIITDWASTRPYVTVLTEPKAGACAARNRGLREVITEWTMFFDSDDLMLPNHVADFVKGIERHPDCDLLGRDTWIDYPDGKAVTGYFMCRFSPMLWNLWRGSLATQRYVARTELFRRAGGWDESIFGWNDLELGVRLILAGARMAKLTGKPSVKVRFQEVSITGRFKSDNPERWEHALATIRRNIAALPASRRERNRWLAWVDIRAALLAAVYYKEAWYSDTNKDLYRREANAVSLYERVKAVTLCPRTVDFVYNYYERITRVTRPALRLLRHIF